MELIQNYSYIQLITYSFFLWIIFKILLFIYKNFIRKRINLQKRYGADSWVVITGSTDGIGKAFARAFALDGFNIIQVSRNPEKLLKTSKELRKINSKILTHEITFDFNQRNSTSDYIETFNNIQNKFDVSILINNVGCDFHIPWRDFTIDQVHELINVNILSQAFLTKILFEKMSNRKPKSAFINLSSFSSDFPFPMKALYSSTKIFNHYLTSALNNEHEHTKSNIDFLSAKPLGVETPMTGKQADGVSIITADKCVECILNDLYYEEETYGHWLHKIQAFVINGIPKFILYPLLRKFWYSLIMKQKLA